MKKFLIFIVLILFTFNVSALEKNISSNIKYNVSLPGGSYGGDDLSDGYNTIMGRYTVGTRYNGRLGYLEFYLSTDDFNFVINHTYTITLNMATNDWRNNFMSPQVIKCNLDGSIQSTNSGLTVSNFRFISRKQIKFNFKTNGTLSPYLLFRLYSLNYASQGGTAITGDSNWNLSSIVISNNSSSGSSGGSATPAPTATPSPSNQDIINNASQNTTDIIDNANQNTNDIIDNNNANTKEIIENNQKLLGDCITNLMTGSDVLSLDNLYMSGNNFQQITADDNPTISLSLQAYNNNTYLYNIGDTQYITQTKTYTIRFTKSADFNRVKLKLNGRTRDTGLIIDVSFLPDDHVYYISADFFRITQGDIRFNRLIIKESSSPGFVSWGETVCTSKLDSANNSINEVNDSINNSNIDNGLGNEFFDDFTSNDFGLSSIITIPLNTIQSLTSKSCVALSVPIPFTNSNVSLPCMTEVYENNIPTIYNLWKIVSFGIISYFIAIDIFHLVKGFKDPESDKVEVLDL